jgi:hypothetical protein
LHRLDDRPVRGQVSDGVDAVEGPGHDVGVADVTLDELDVEAGEVVAASPCEVVERPDRGPALEESGDQVRADEAAAAGDEDLPGNVL